MNCNIFYFHWIARRDIQSMGHIFRIIWVLLRSRVRVRRLKFPQFKFVLGGDLSVRVRWCNHLSRTSGVQGEPNVRISSIIHRVISGEIVRNGAVTPRKEMYRRVSYIRKSDWQFRQRSGITDLKEFQSSHGVSRLRLYGRKKNREREAVESRMSYE